MSFNYTPPPDEVIRTGQIATTILYASLILVPRTKLGAIIGGLGSAAITYWVASHAKGDLGGLSALIGPPIHAVFGALIGALISLVSQTVVRFVLKHLRSKTYPFGDEQNSHSTTN